MPHIHWAGILRSEPAEYQKGALRGDAKKLAMPASMRELTIKALPFAAVPLALIFFSVFLKTFLAGEAVLSPAFFALGFLAGFAGLPAHEWLHAVVYPAQTVVTIGFYPKAFAAVALVSYPLKRRRFILMSLLPLLLGLVPLVLFWLGPAAWKAWNGFWFGFSIMGLISPYPDCFCVYQVLRQTPPGCRIQNHKDETYWLE